MLVLLMGAVDANAAVMFRDSFDRPDNTNIDADSTGMSGPLAPMVYQEAFEGSGQPSSIQILSNQLNVAVGAGMSSMYLDHNFTDADILLAGGFSVSLDVVSITNANDQANRFGGFGVGNTLAEAQAAADCFDSAFPFRGVVGQADKGISDLFVDLALDQNVRIWNNGHIVNTINVGAASGTIKADFLLTDFAAGSSVTALVYFNGAAIDTQSFTWDNTGANYLGISGRTAGAGVFLDNLQIAAIPEPATLALLGLGTLLLRRRK
ncbi:MAG: PEP-CTERM sorting domain-containing protein [Sedimentisphaerales bacterium]|nr:PEP-CTERM sorting domain-containing protein [Sedimentisphaerales bacterium]